MLSPFAETSGIPLPARLYIPPLAPILILLPAVAS